MQQNNLNSLHSNPQAEDFYALNEEVAAAAEAAAAGDADGEPSNELSSYTLPDTELVSRQLDFIC